MALTAVVLAAGHGKRMKSNLVKVMHPVGGKPMVGHVVASARAAGAERIAVVVGVGAEQVRAYLDGEVEFVTQSEQLGTGHALLQAESLLAGSKGTLLVLYGDAPLLTPDVLRELLAIHRRQGTVATVLTAHVPDPTGYGRIVRAPDGSLDRIVEEADASPAERAIQEINTGIYCLEFQGIRDREGVSYSLFDVLKRIRNDNAQHEYYLTDLNLVLGQMGQRVGIATVPSNDWVLFPNSRRQLAEAERIYRRRILNHWMDEGVTIIDPNATYIDADVRIGRDTTIWPGTFLQGNTRIGERCEVGPNTRIVASQIGNDVRIEMSVIEQSTLGDECHIGPYAHLRPRCVLGRGVEFGNYAEAKNTVFGDGVKCHHHSYLGDTEIGERANIGAGVITANYDGYNKHRTRIGPGVFVGTNVNLVAPIELGPGAYVGAGSTVTKDVPADALAVERAPQIIKPGHAKVLRERARRRAQAAPDE